MIATLGQREKRLNELLGVLTPQVEKANGDVEVVIFWNNFEHRLGYIRQSLVEQAKGEYVCFVDDDDLVPDYYCEEILRALGKDYVGWQMQYYENGEPAKPTFHSIRYKEWSDDDKGFYRNISHLNPIKRSIALKVSFDTEKGEAEDQPWAERVAKFVKTENYIDEIMYFYRHNQLDSLWRGGQIERHFTRPELTYKCMRYIDG